MRTARAAVVDQYALVSVGSGGEGRELVDMLKSGADSATARIVGYVIESACGVRQPHSGGDALVGGASLVGAFLSFVGLIALVVF